MDAKSLGPPGVTALLGHRSLGEVGKCCRGARAHTATRESRSACTGERRCRRPQAEPPGRERGDGGRLSRRSARVGIRSGIGRGPGVVGLGDGSREQQRVGVRRLRRRLQQAPHRAAGQTGAERSDALGRREEAGNVRPRLDEAVQLGAERRPPPRGSSAGTRGEQPLEVPGAPLPDELECVPGQQVPGRLFPGRLACMLGRLLEPPGALAGDGRSLVQLGGANRGDPEQLGAKELTDRSQISVFPLRAVERKEEGAAVRESAERRARVSPVEQGVAQRRSEPLEHRGLEQERPQPVVALGVEQLEAEIVGDAA